MCVGDIMDCEGFDKRLDALLDGDCTAGDWRSAEGHAGECARCRRVLDAMAGRGADLDEAGHASLTAAIVARTGGNPCAAARDRLCNFVDGALAGFDRELVESHVAHCPTCAALADAIDRSTRVLPSFAELETPSSFSRDVLSATSRRPAQPTPGERLLAWLAGVARRPRFSVEVAYVCTALLLAVLGDPVKAFRDASLQVRPRVEVAAQALARPLARARSVGAGTIAAVTSVARPTAARGMTTEDGPATAVYRWWLARVDAPIRAIFSQAADWARAAVDAVAGVVRKVWSVGAPVGQDVSPARPVEPRRPAAR